ncbi:MAG: hypothetical protein KTR15_06950 [Phycisphaeraceae bacterium]|nr:hypothetical protein [Phycisphaeraceae bacterium]
MADQPTTFAFPNQDALCERCGYSIKGLASDAACPECGQPVAESSPTKRTLVLAGPWLTLKLYARMLGLFLLRPKQSFRSLAIRSDGVIPEQFLFRNSFLAGLIISAIVFIGSAFIIPPRFHTIPIQSALILFIACSIGISLLTYIEMLGVTAFSRRRGWRVPFPLAQRICCLASVGWLPGAAFVGLGIWMIQAFGVGRPWFDHLLGLVRVGWLLYAGLFVLSFLWFETLVWIAVRQVRFANAWPDLPQSTPKT